MSELPSVDPSPSASYFHISPVASTYEARIFALRELRDYTQSMVGGLLTLMDAAGLERKQFDALKRLIHRELWDQHYQRAMEWAERETSIEHRQGIPFHSWADVNAHRASHPTSEDFNIFPFSGRALTVTVNPPTE